MTKCKAEISFKTFNAEKEHAKARGFISNASLPVMQCTSRCHYLQTASARLQGVWIRLEIQPEYNEYQSRNIRGFVQRPDGDSDTINAVYLALQKKWKVLTASLIIRVMTALGRFRSSGLSAITSTLTQPAHCVSQISKGTSADYTTWFQCYRIN